MADDQVLAVIGQAEAVLLAAEQGGADGLGDAAVPGEEPQQEAQRRLAALAQRAQRGRPLLHVALQRGVCPQVHLRRTGAGCVMSLSDHEHPSVLAVLSSLGSL